MEEVDFRKIIKEELATSRKKDKVAGTFYAFAIWVGTITLASFLLTWWAVRQDLGEDKVDTIALIIVVASVLIVAGVLWIIARSDGKGARQ